MPHLGVFLLESTKRTALGSLIKKKNTKINTYTYLFGKIKYLRIPVVVDEEKI